MGYTEPSGEPVAAEAPAQAQAEPRSSPVELLWDLVFVFAITQVTILLSESLNWGGFGRAMLVLALVWWAWSAFVWAANAEPATSTVPRLVLIVATACIFVVALAMPGAFGHKEAWLFAVAYAVVRLLHLILYADASRRGNAAWSAIAGFAVTVVIGLALLVTGAFLHGGWRIALWTAAVAIDYAGPGWLTRQRLRGLQHVAVAHFAERYGLFVIICLGESIVSIGAAAVNGPRGGSRMLTSEVTVAVVMCLVITIGLWWAYFQGSAQSAERRLREHSDPVLAAVDGYSYLHLPLVAGIIVFAVGARFLVRENPLHPMHDPMRLALCGGIVVYLLAHAAFALRLGVRVSPWRIAATAALAVLYLAGASLVGWLVAAIAATIVALLCAVETLTAGPVGPTDRPAGEV